MKHTRSFIISMALAMSLFSLGYTQEFSRYRDFQLGMSLAAAAKQSEVPVSEAKSISLRPALIQELEWKSWTSSNASSRLDPVKGILFDFYNGELFQILVSYDQNLTEGLTDEDLIESISTHYGSPVRPVETIHVFSPAHLYSQDAKLIARWEDSQYSFNLFRASYQATPGMLIFSKRLQLLAQAAMVEAARLDAQEAPQREIDRQRKQDEEKHAAARKVRPANKVNFRP